MNRDEYTVCYILALSSNGIDTESIARRIRTEKTSKGLVWQHTDVHDINKLIDLLKTYQKEIKEYGKISWIKYI